MAAIGTVRLLVCVFVETSVPPCWAGSFWHSPQKEPKGLAPGIRPRLRRDSLTPSSLQGLAAKGHPWPIASFAASMPLNPFRNDSVRPPEGGDWSCLTVLHFCPDGSHAPRGNPSSDAPRHRVVCGAKQTVGAERQRLHSHAERGNDQTIKRSTRNARSAKKNHQAPRSPSPRQEAEWRCCAGGRAAWMRREA